jgi:hypothetical protein
MPLDAIDREPEDEPPLWRIVQEIIAAEMFFGRCTPASVPISCAARSQVIAGGGK